MNLQLGKSAGLYGLAPGEAEEDKRLQHDISHMALGALWHDKYIPFGPFAQCPGGLEWNKRSLGTNDITAHLTRS